MSLSNENGMVMPVQPVNYGNGGYGMPYAVPMYGNFGGGFGDGFGSDWIILFLIAAMFGGFGGGWGMNGFGGGYEFPWLLASNTNTDNLVSAGFNQAATANTLSSIQNSITSGFGDVQLGIAGVNQNICQTGNGIISAITNGNNALTQQMYSNQIADLNRSFASQTAMTQGLNAIQSQQADCCCENRLATADLKYTIATENCADRAALSDGIRDVIANSTAQTQAILDKLCALELDGYKRENDNLRQQLNMSQLAASQNAQTALFQQGLTNEVDALYNRLSNCPIPTTPVYGRTPIFTCGSNPCGCGNGNGVF